MAQVYPPSTTACATTRTPSSRMAQFFASLEARDASGDSQADAEVAGFRLKNESPTLIWAFRELVVKSDEPYAPTGSSPDNSDLSGLTKRVRQSSTCRKVICAADALFGAEIGRRMIYLQARFNLNTSKLVFRNAETFGVSQLDSIINAAHLYPDRLLPISENKQTIKIRRGLISNLDNPHDPNILANATMSFFDLWSDSSPQVRVYTVVHEIAHNLSFSQVPAKMSSSVLFTDSQRLDTSPSWLKLSGWVAERAAKRNNSTVRFVSEYAQTNAAEDFAEAVTYYMLEPTKLKVIHPEKYDFIRFYVFGGEEFASTLCHNPTILNEFKSKYAETNVLTSTAEIQATAEACVPLAFLPFNQQNTEQCIARRQIDQILKSDYGVTSGLIPIELSDPITQHFKIHFSKVDAQVIDYAQKHEKFSIYHKTN